MNPTRRQLLQQMAATAVACGCATPLLRAASIPRPAPIRMLQRPTTGARTLVVIELQGGCDMLSVLPPDLGLGGPVAGQYVSLRPTVSTTAQSALALAGVTGFRLHPQLTRIATEFNGGDAAIIQKVGLPAAELSHFKSRDTMAFGRANTLNADRRGWLGRVADHYFTNSLDIVSMGAASGPITVANTVHPSVLSDLASFQIQGFLNGYDTTLRRNLLSQMCAQVFPTEHAILKAGRVAAINGTAAATTLATATAGITAGPGYPSSGYELLGQTLPDILKLIRGSVGTRIFYTQSRDFDTHGGQVNQASFGKPTLSTRLGYVNQALDAFIADLKSPAVNKWNETAILLYTEFGRRNLENQTGGTDHGYGFHAIVLGGAVNGGLKGATVSLSDLTSSTGYLPAQIDYRTVLRKCVQDWLGLDPLVAVGSAHPIFDDFTPLPTEPSFVLF